MAAILSRPQYVNQPELGIGPSAPQGMSGLKGYLLLIQLANDETYYM